MGSSIITGILVYTFCIQICFSHFTPSASSTARPPVVDGQCHKYVMPKQVQKTFYFIDKKVNWHEAEQLCYQNNTHLPTVRSRQESQNLISLMILHDVSTVWIGAHDMKEEGQFNWVEDGSPIGYTRWQRGEPNNNAGYGGQDCVIMGSNGLWRDLNCNNELYRVACQMYV